MAGFWLSLHWLWMWLHSILRQWQPQHRFGRIEAPRPTIKSNRKPEWVVRQLVLLKAHLPQAGCRTIALTFNRVFAHRDATVSKSFVNAVLRRNAHAVVLARRAIRSARPRAVAVNHCWGLDMTGRADAAGNVHTILGIIDHGSRCAVKLVRLTRCCGWTLLGHLCLTIGEFGKPRFVRTDNERCLTGGAFGAGLRLLGIGHQRTSLHCPWQNGRIERVFGTLKQTLRQCLFADAAMLDALLADFGRWYNEIRPHQSLGGLTPVEAWHGVDAFHAPATPKAVEFVEGWDGLLSGFRIRR